MSLMRYEPWGLLNQLRREMDNLYPQGDDGTALETAAWRPSVDIKELDDAYMIFADIPGVDPNDIEVQMDNNVLTIKGERESVNDQTREGYKRVERVSGSFSRRFTLPEAVDADSIAAKSHHGVLEIRVPKQEKPQPRRIEVAH